MSIEDRITDNKEKLLSELEVYPVIDAACARSHIARATYYRWCEDDPSFAQTAKDAIAKGVAHINDNAESKVIRMIEEDNLSAIKYWLSHRHSEFRNGYIPVVFQR